MIAYSDLLKGKVYRVYEGHVCFRMYYVGNQNGKEYFSRNKSGDFNESFYFKKWESIDD